MATGRGGSSIKTKLGFLVYGEQGTRKSSFCLEALKLVNEDGRPFRVLYIDAEQGSVDTYLDFYEEAGYDLRNIYIVYTQSLSEVREFIKRAKNNEDFYDFDEETGEETDTVYLDADGMPFRPDMVVVDGVTLLYIARQQSMIEFSKKRATVRAQKNEVVGMAKEVAIEGAGLEIKDYNTLKFDGQDLILDLLACGKHFAVTCREEDEKEQYKDKNGEIKMMATGRKQPTGFKDIRYNVKTVIRLFKDTDGVIKGHIENKDRTLVHQQDEIIIEPSMTDWQSVITKNKSKKNFTVANNLNNAVEIERKSIEKDNAKFDEAYEDEVKNPLTSELKSAEDYHVAIKKAIEKLTPTDKAKRSTECASAGLPKAYQKLTDLNQLKTYLDIVGGK
jgi:hypothetical protein